MKAAYGRSSAEKRVIERLGFASIYALGPTEGPDCGWLLLGTAASDKQLRQAINSASYFSCRPIALQLLLHTTGDPRAKQLKRMAGEQMGADGIDSRGPWFRVSPGDLSDRILALGAAIGADIFDEAGRQARILEALSREMRRVSYD